MLLNLVSCFLLPEWKWIDRVKNEYCKHLSSSMNKRNDNCKYKFFKHSPFKHQLPLKKNLNEFLSSRDVEGKRLNIFKSKVPTETHRRAVLKILRGLATEVIAYHTLANENMSQLVIPLYPNWLSSLVLPESQGSPAS